MKRLLNVRLLPAATSFVLLVLVWILFAPVQIGGQAFYVIVNGNSMEPVFHLGDLVVVRTAADYNVGDIVVYKYPGIGSVIHRIINVDGNTFQMKGDNNSWVDGYQPVKQDIVGKYWFVIRGVGKWIKVINSPWIIAIITGIICLLVGLSMIQKTNKNNPQRKSSFSHTIDQIGYGIANSRESYYWLMYALGLIAIVLGIFAFTRPITQTTSDKISFQQSGVYNYSGTVDQNVYDTKNFATGDPVFMALSCNVNFTFDYSLNTQTPFSGGGNYQMLAVLQGNNGWKRSFALTPVTNFSGTNFNPNPV